MRAVNFYILIFLFIENRIILQTVQRQWIWQRVFASPFFPLSEQKAVASPTALFHA
jgi:hypothetical protein